MHSSVNASLSFSWQLVRAGACGTDATHQRYVGSRGFVDAAAIGR
jgi:hypothetical protein